MLLSVSHSVFLSLCLSLTLSFPHSVFLSVSHSLILSITIYFLPSLPFCVSLILYSLSLWSSLPASVPQHFSLCIQLSLLHLALPLPCSFSAFHPSHRHGFISRQSLDSYLVVTELISLAKAYQWRVKIMFSKSRFATHWFYSNKKTLRSKKVWKTHLF